MGQPRSGHAGRSRTEYIGAGSDTRGSETSQYPEEEKSTEIPQVVASERGTAQTRPLAAGGCGTSTWIRERLAEAPGKVRHSR